MPWLFLLGALVCADPGFDPGAREATLVLHADAQQGRRWTWGWGGALGANGVAQLTLAALTHDDGFRIDRLVGGGTSLFGLLTVIVRRPSAMSAERELGACPTKQAADAALARVAAEERFAQAWYQHVLAAVFSTGGGLYLGLAHDRWRSGVVQTVGGLAASELMLFTRPSRVRRFVVLPVVAGAISPRAYGLTLSAQF